MAIRNLKLSPKLLSGLERFGYSIHLSEENTKNGTAGSIATDGSVVIVLLIRDITKAGYLVDHLAMNVRDEERDSVRSMGKENFDMTTQYT